MIGIIGERHKLKRTSEKEEHSCLGCFHQKHECAQINAEAQCTTNRSILVLDAGISIFVVGGVVDFGDELQCDRLGVVDTDSRLIEHDALPGDANPPDDRSDPADRTYEGHHLVEYSRRRFEALVEPAIVYKPRRQANGGDGANYPEIPPQDRRTTRYRHDWPPGSEKQTHANWRVPIPFPAISHDVFQEQNHQRHQRNFLLDPSLSSCPSCLRG